MSLSIKPGVRVFGLRPETILALNIIEGAFKDAGYDCVLTCGMDGKHSKGSLHYAGCAVDLRISNVPPEKREALKLEMANRLGADFDVILEGDHFHVEYQPKNFYGA